MRQAQLHIQRFNLAKIKSPYSTSAACKRHMTGKRQADGALISSHSAPPSFSAPF